MSKRVLFIEQTLGRVESVWSREERKWICSVILADGSELINLRVNNSREVKQLEREVEKTMRRATQVQIVWRTPVGNTTKPVNRAVTREPKRGR